jgi:hypothetical protein
VYTDIKAKSGRLKLGFHQAFCAIILGASSTSLKDELRVGPGAGLSRLLAFVIPLVIVTILASVAIALLIGRRPKK